MTQYARIHIGSGVLRTNCARIIFIVTLILKVQFYAKRKIRSSYNIVVETLYYIVILVYPIYSVKVLKWLFLRLSLRFLLLLLLLLSQTRESFIVASNITFPPREMQVYTIHTIFFRSLSRQTLNYVTRV